VSVSADSAASEDGHMAELIALIWSDHVNTAKSGMFLLLSLRFLEDRASSSRGSFKRRLISLM
jgi:hypothetical protein